MHRSQAFTILELLVVVSIIVVLLALLSPAMHQVIDRAIEVQCMSNLRNFGQANAQYATDSRQWYVPIKTANGSNASGGYDIWYKNKLYVEYAGGTYEAGWGKAQWPSENIICPNTLSHRIANRDIRRTYGMTWTASVYPWAGEISVRRIEILAPSGKLQMTEAAGNWHVRKLHSVPTQFWMVYGDNGPDEDANSPGSHTAYRHSGKATLQYFDLHVEVRDSDYIRYDNPGNGKLWDYIAANQ